MNNRIEKIKEHVRENRTAYISGTVCLIVGVAGTLVVCNQKELIQIIDSFKIQWKSPTTNNITTILVRRGHPGYIVKCNETGEVFASQSRAAEALGLNQGALSKHLNGRSPHVRGYTFQNLGEAQAA